LTGNTSSYDIDFIFLSFSAVMIHEAEGRWYVSLLFAEVFGYLPDSLAGVLINPSDTEKNFPCIL